MRSAPLGLVLVSALACACASAKHEPDAVTLRQPRSTASAPPAPPLPPVSPAPELDMVGGDLVDTRAMKVVRTLTKDNVFRHALSGDAAYLWMRGEVRAYDVSSGALRWSKPEDSCYRIAALSGGLFCTTSGDLHFYRASDGAMSLPLPGASTTYLVTLGARVLAVGSGQIDSFDESAHLVARMNASTSLYALAVAGRLACGVDADDKGADVICVTPTAVAWRKRVPVSQGQLVQADADVLVVAAGPWGNRHGGVVLRTSDGAELLRSTARLGGALVRAGRVEAALSLDPPVTLLDDRGATLWTWRPQYPPEAARAAQVGDVVAVALYSPIATGTELVGLDRASGRLVWRADVESLPISHSKYSNEVRVEASGSSVTLIGIESAQELRETFDAATGKRTASIVRGR